MSELASRNSLLSTREDLSRLTQGACLELLRRSKDWNSCSLSADKFGGGLGGGGAQQAEGFFQRAAVTERAKFERENAGSAGAMLIPSQQARVPTQAVVSLIVAVRGSSGMFSYLHIYIYIPPPHSPLLSLFLCVCVCLPVCLSFSVYVSLSLSACVCVFFRRVK